MFAASDARIGAWSLVRELGRGGMGTVYLAERADGQFDQRVALKLVRSDASPADLVRRPGGEGYATLRDGRRYHDAWRCLWVRCVGDGRLGQ